MRILKRLKLSRRRLRQVVLAAAAMGSVFIAAFAAIWFTYPFPADRLANLPVSPQVTDRTGRVLLHIVGRDDHWRSPVKLQEMSPWLPLATVASEDERFFSHSGVDSIAVSRAVWQNVRSHRIVSGASTLTMQLCRMLDERPRTLSAKLIESVRAIQAEQVLAKPDILEQYLNLAPYGGNVRGVEAAAHRYFGRGCSELSLGQASLLAGLPQAPSLYRPDRFPEAAVERRRHVLNRMLEAGMISKTQRHQAESEPVSLVSISTANRAEFGSHAAWLALQQRPRGSRTTIDANLQELVESEARRHAKTLPPGSDVAVVVIDISTAEIRVLVGSADPLDPVDGQNNGVLALRSPGSTLKPFLYATAFESRRLNAESVVPDNPVTRAGWTPDNFDRSFRGTITVAEALRDSRNVPAIRVMEAMGVSRCLGVISACGIHLPSNTEARGGLAIAVGGVETTLLDLTNAYATLGREGVYRKPRLFAKISPTKESPDERQALSSATCRTLNEILSTRNRLPNGLSHSESETNLWLMWKTGTSSGRRDAWAIGHNGRFAIGVWTGRFSGSGHPDFVGRDAAEPLLAQLFATRNIRVDINPYPPTSILVDRELNFAAPNQRSPVINSPTRDAEFLALNQGKANVPVEVVSSERTTWFLNNHLLSPGPRRILKLIRGQYELRCITSGGHAAAVQFTVR
jgi:penicillin-binding protein 1C